MGSAFLEHSVHGRECGSHRRNRPERRPVVLSEREERLYRLAFTSVDKKEFLKLINLGRWVDCLPGHLILEKDRPISDVTVLISGDVEAIFASGTRMAFRPGQLIGDVSVYSGLASPVDVVARSYGTLVKWDWRQLVEFMASRPALRAKLLTLVSADLAAKLREITTAMCGLVLEQSAPR